MPFDSGEPNNEMPLSEEELNELARNLRRHICSYALDLLAKKSYISPERREDIQERMDEDGSIDKLVEISIEEIGEETNEPRAWYVLLGHLRESNVDEIPPDTRSMIEGIAEIVAGKENYQPRPLW